MSVVIIFVLFTFVERFKFIVLIFIRLFNEIFWSRILDREPCLSNERNCEDFFIYIHNSFLQALTLEFL